MRDIIIRFNNNGGYEFGANLKGHKVKARVDENGTCAVKSEELLRIGCNVKLVYTDYTWLFCGTEFTEVKPKRFTRGELLVSLDLKAPLSKRIRRMIKWGKRK